MTNEEEKEYLRLKWMRSVEIEDAVKEVLELLNSCKETGNSPNIDWIKKTLEDAFNEPTH